MEIELQPLDRNSNDFKILVTGASGFIGSRLLKQLMKINDENNNTKNRNFSILCITRNKKSFDTDSLKKNGNSKIEVIEGDLSNYDDCLKALKGVDIAYYLVHSMEGSSKNWKKFSEKEQKTAENFAKAADKCGVKRIIFLGGLTYGKESELSQHMLSRKHVGNILKKIKFEGDNFSSCRYTRKRWRFF